MPIAKLPIGVQSFSEIITGGYTYIDKTQYVYNIVTQGKPYFLSRPRRFGKSVLISTFEALFLAKRELFKGLWIDDSDWEWQTYPVIRLDMSQINNDDAETFKQALICRIQEMAEQHNITLKGSKPAHRLF